VNYQSNADFAKSLYPQVKNILAKNAMIFISLRESTFDEDTKNATDFVVEIKGGDVAVRTRRNNTAYRDFTLRSACGRSVTELQKIKSGFARWYLYGWTDNNSIISEYIIVDLDKVRQCKLLDNRKETINKDGYTKFIAIPISELRDNCCLVAEFVKK